ncbi:MAG: ABC-type transport auxiliary lipoprotein family protein [Azonexus sp.]
MRGLIFLIGSLLLTGCFTAGKRGGDAPLAIYDFGPPAARLMTTPRKTPLALEVRAPLWFDSMGIDYRLAYVDAARLREYARARWAGPPAQLLQQRLTQQLDLSPAGFGQSPCLLRVDITEFSQIFSSAERSRGVLQGRVVLLDRTLRTLAEMPVNVEKPAETADARGGVGALIQAADQLAVDLLAWEWGQGRTAAAGGCFD